MINTLHERFHETSKTFAESLYSFSAAAAAMPSQTATQGLLNRYGVQLPDYVPEEGAAMILDASAISSPTSLDDHGLI